MLKNLFSSSIRLELLAFLLNNPDERYYVREIAKLLRKNPSGVKRELDNLEEMGILTSEKVANLRYFQANRESPLFSELKNLIAKSLGLPGALKQFLKTSGVRIAFLFGPYAENEESPTVDILVVGESSLSLLVGLHGFEEKFGKKINCTIMAENEYKTKKGKDAGLKRIISGKRISIIGRV